MGLVFDWLVNPETGERVTLHAYLRQGRLVISLLPRQNTSDPGSPAVLQARAAFATAATQSYGDRMRPGQSLPPAAELVARETRGLAHGPRPRSGSQLSRAQLRFRDLIGEETVEQLYRLLDPESRSRKK